jgi:hypothetical protein
MKKIYALSVLSMLLGNICFSQILSSNHPVTDYSGPANVLQSAHALLVNNSSQTLNVICERVSRQMAPLHYSYFCMTICYDTSVWISPSPLTIGPNASVNNFEGWVGAQNSAGIDTVTYKFYDMNGLSDTLVLTFTYEFTATSGINELASKYAFNITGANPANTQTSVSYSVPQQKDARVIVSNLLGSKVSEIKLNTKMNSMTFSVADLNSGVYVYSLMIDGRIVSSKKLIIAHQ